MCGDSEGPEPSSVVLTLEEGQSVLIVVDGDTAVAVGNYVVNIRPEA